MIGMNGLGWAAAIRRIGACRLIATAIGNVRLMRNLRGDATIRVPPGTADDP